MHVETAAVSSVVREHVEHAAAALREGALVIDVVDVVLLEQHFENGVLRLLAEEGPEQHVLAGAVEMPSDWNEELNCGQL